MGGFRHSLGSTLSSMAHISAASSMLKPLSPRIGLTITHEVRNDAPRMVFKQFHR